MTVEIVAYHHYEIKERRKSKLGLPVDVIETIAFKCPRCGTPNAALNHGQAGQCEVCTLYFQLWGNELHCSDEPFADTSVFDNFTEHGREPCSDPVGMYLDD